MNEKSKITDLVGRAPEQVLESSVSPTDRAGHPWGAGRWWFAAWGPNAVCFFQLTPQAFQTSAPGRSRLRVPRTGSVTECASVSRELCCPAKPKTLLVPVGSRFTSQTHLRTTPCLPVHWSFPRSPYCQRGLPSGQNESLNRCPHPRVHACTPSK